MAQKCGKRLKFGANALDMWEIDEIYNKWLSCVRIGLNKQKIAQKCLKWLMYVGNDFDMCQVPYL